MIGSIRLAPTPERLSRLFLWIGCALVLAVSVEASYELAVGADKLYVIMPVGAVVGGAMVWLGYVNFEAFVLFTIALRSSLDVTRPQLGNSGASGIGSAQASGLDPAGALAALFMLVTVFWFLTRKRYGATSPAPSVHRIALITFAAVGYLSIIGSDRQLVSLLEAVRVSAVAAMLAVLEIMLSNRRAIKRLVVAIYASSIVPVGYATILILLHKPQFVSGGFARYEGTFSQPNPFAIYLCMLIVMGVALLPHLGWRLRAVMLAALGLYFFSLYHTYTRSAWVAAVIGIVAVIWLGRRKAAAIALVAGVLVAMLVVPTIGERFLDLGSAFGGSTVNASGNTSNSLAWRFDYWGQVLPLANSNPLTGIGLKMSSFMTDQAKEPHNDFLRAYVETGVIGLAGYLWLLVSMIIVAREGMRQSGPGFDRSIAIGFAGCVTAFVLISLVSNVITEVIVLWYYIAFAAAAYAVTKFPAEEREPEPEPERPARAELQPQLAPGGQAG